MLFRSTGVITITSATCTGTSSTNFTVSCGSVLTVRAFIQGYYDDACVLCGTMKPVLLASNVVGATSTQVDTVTIELHAASSPYGFVESSSGILSTTGFVGVPFSGARVGGSYFIVIKHRNSIDTWSSTAHTIASVDTFDFTSGSGQAYQNQFPVDPPPYTLAPLIQVQPGIWAIYNGDVGSGTYAVLDGLCDVSDGNWLEQDANIYNTIQIPDYYVTDITGDGVPDVSDYNLEETNFLIDGTNAVVSQYPH